ncbi:diacylglycerol kinase [Glaciihabitans tibetensis]|uniref:Diacylglycerol kinase n=2 Tax=Glaciihabitans tibetensis TaxID=1266600 RepID=A0A2T0VG13_9MICO|nr:diacylglycerol kinase [Glaciihabitans tibetensis]
MPRRRELVVAINPAAGFGASRGVGTQVVAALRNHGHGVVALQAASLAELVEATRLALVGRPDALVVVGGDGMVNFGAGLLVGSDIPLGIIACGTGNDLARGLGLPLNKPDVAVEALLESLDRGGRVIDAVRVTSASGERRWFAGALSAGFDAIVNERANAMRRPRGKSRYILALLIELVRLRPIRYRLVLDGEELTTDALLVSVGNNVSIGGGMKVTPNAVMDDGLLDILVVRPLSRLAFLRIFPRVFAGTHLTDPRVSIHRARTVRIEADSVVAYADGERFGPLPLELEVSEGVLRVLA